MQFGAIAAGGRAAVIEAAPDDEAFAACPGLLAAMPGIAARLRAMAARIAASVDTTLAMAAMWAYSLP